MGQATPYGDAELASFLAYVHAYGESLPFTRNFAGLAYRAARTTATPDSTHTSIERYPTTIGADISSYPHPWPVLYRLGNMRRQDLIAFGEIGDGTRQLEQPVERASRET